MPPLVGAEPASARCTVALVCFQLVTLDIYYHDTVYIIRTVSTLETARDADWADARSAPTF